jgi:hypothetical protein
MIITWPHLASICKYNGMYCYETGKTCAVEICPFVEESPHDGKPSAGEQTPLEIQETFC